MADYMRLVHLAAKLDKAYGTSEYDKLLQQIKIQGYRVFRNSKGEHKLEANPIMDFFGNMWNGNTSMTWGE